MTWLLQLLGLGGGGLGDQLRRAYEAKLAATNDADRIAADIQIEQIGARMASHNIGGRWITAVQLAWALPFVIYNGKLILWDKVFGLGATDPLSPELYGLQTVIVGFFFISTTIKGIIR